MMKDKLAILALRAIAEQTRLVSRTMLRRGTSIGRANELLRGRLTPDFGEVPSIVAFLRVMEAFERCPMPEADARMFYHQLLRDIAITLERDANALEAGE
jgi:hypothetical protein